MSILLRNIVVAALSFGPMFGQVSPSLTFEVASVKPAVVPTNAPVFFGPARGGPGTHDPGQISWAYARLIDILMAAYDVRTYQVRGPAWMSNERYDIAAKVPEGATKEQVREMWKSLLAERFAVVLHHEPKDFQVEELVIAKGGSKLKDTTVENPDAEGPPQMNKGVLTGPGFVTMVAMGPSGPTAHSMAKAQSISRLTATLSAQLNRPVVDKTGLTGRYDFDLEYTPVLPANAPFPPRSPGESANDPGPDIGEAIERQLGLRLVAAKANLDVIVVDKAEKAPTAN